MKLEPYGTYSLNRRKVIYIYLYGNFQVSSCENNILDANGPPEKTFYVNLNGTHYHLLECHWSHVFYTNPNGSIQIKKMHSKTVKLEVHIQGLGWLDWHETLHIDGSHLDLSSRTVPRIDVDLGGPHKAVRKFLRWACVHLKGAHSIHTCIFWCVH